MAIFGKKKDDDQLQSGDNGSDMPAINPAASDELPFQPQPEKARKFFQHARNAADMGNHEYAIYMYASGLKLDPEEMKVHNEMFESAKKFLNKKGKPASRSDLKKLDGDHPVDKFVIAEFAWMRNLTNASLGVKLVEAAADAEQNEFGRWMAPKLLNIIANQKKPSASQFKAAMRAFEKVHAWEEAIRAGQLAYQLDPTDGALQTELKNLAAQRAMDQGGYDDAGGEEGGFRKFVKNSDEQQQLVEDESISGAGSSTERVLARAKAAVEAEPTNGEAISKYAKLLLREQTPEAEEQAYKVYMRGFADTQEFRFRMAASDIKLRQADQQVKALEARVKTDPSNEELKEELEQTKRNTLLYKSAEFQEREAKYPTDRVIKYQRGDVEFQLGNFENAMAAFQQAKDEPKLRVKAGHRLGLCFAAEGWHSEAEGEFREALDNLDATSSDQELFIRYDLMVSLIAQAKADSSIDKAKEALDICSGIARKDITFRDIRARRKEIDGLIKELND